MKWDIEKIKNDVKKSLSEKRYQHTLNVIEEIEKLALHYNVSKDEIIKYKLCALTHDLTKELSIEENKNIIKRYNLNKNFLDLEYKNTIHGFIASIIVREKYKFTEDMILAIRYHTTGYPNMDLLGKLTYLADKIEKERENDMVKKARELAYQNIDKAIIYIITKQIEKLTKENQKIKDISYDTLEYLKEINK